MRHITILEQSGFLADLAALIEELLSPQYGEYDNLSLSTTTLGNIRMTVIAFFLAIMVSAVIISLNRNVYGSLIVAINGEAAWSADKAKTLGELGMMKNPAVRAGLRGSTYRGLVHCVEQEKFNEEQENLRKAAEEKARDEGKKKTTFRTLTYRLNFETDHFYIPEKDTYKAETRFERKGTGLIPVLIIIIVSFAAMVLVIKYLPDIIMLLNNFVGIMADKTSSQ